MGFPGQRTLDPWKIEQAVDSASFVQGVVIATTRLLHDGATSLTARDRDSLAKCRQLLACAAAPDCEPAPPPSIEEPRLEPAKAAVLVRAARAASPGGAISFEELVTVLSAALEEEALDEHALKAIGELRDMFLAIGEANLKSITAARNSRRDFGAWTPLTTSLRS
jgi:hypothetical protein